MRLPSYRRARALFITTLCLGLASFYWPYTRFSDLKTQLSSANITNITLQAQSNPTPLDPELTHYAQTLRSTREKITKTENPPQTPTQLNFQLKQMEQSLRSLAQTYNITINPDTPLFYQNYLATDTLPPQDAVPQLALESRLCETFLQTLFAHKPFSFNGLGLIGDGRLRCTISTSMSKFSSFLNDFHSQTLPFSIQGLRIQSIDNTDTLEITLELQPSLGTKNPDFQPAQFAGKPLAVNLVNVSEVVDDELLVESLVPVETSFHWHLVGLTPLPYRIQFDGSVINQAGETLLLFSSTQPRGNFMAKVGEEIPHQHVRVVAYDSEALVVKVFDYKEDRIVEINPTGCLSGHFRAEFEDQNHSRVCTVTEGAEISLGNSRATVSKIDPLVGVITLAFSDDLSTKSLTLEPKTH